MNYKKWKYCLCASSKQLILNNTDKDYIVIKSIEANENGIDMELFNEIVDSSLMLYLAKSK